MLCRHFARAGLGCGRQLLSRSLAITTRRPRVHKWSSMYSQCLTWIDLEMTGLDVHKDVILEIACVVTDSDLNTIAECNHVIHQPESALAAMDHWCTSTHRASGLVAQVQRSNTTLAAAEQAVLAMLSTHTPRGLCPLAGSTVHVDRAFLAKYMPRIDEHLHYRSVDVSSLLELCRRWRPELYNARPRGDGRHRAHSDIQASIRQLQFYRKQLFER